MKTIRRVLISGFALFTVGWLTAPIPHVEELSGATTMQGALLIVGGGIPWLVAKYRRAKSRAIADTKYYMAGIILLLTSPIILVSLATSGGTIIASGGSSGWKPWLANVISGLGFGILLLLLIGFPRILNRDAPWEMVTEQTKRLLPSWMAALATLVTGALVLSMHLLNGPLASISIGRVVIAASAVAILLAPFYKWLIKASWEIGIVSMLSPTRWSRAMREVNHDVNTLTRARHALNCEICKRHAEEIQQIEKGRDAAITAGTQAATTNNKISANAESGSSEL